MKVLTIREPWASLLGVGIKKIETRSWYTSYRGELFIHAGKHKPPIKDKRIQEAMKYISKDELHYGTIFLKCELVDCIPISKEYAKALKEDDPINFYFGNYSEGRYAWILDNISTINPIQTDGRLSIWNYN